MSGQAFGRPGFQQPAGQQQRKLFLLVFLWTCLCLVIFRSSLFGGRADGPQLAAPDVGSDARPAPLPVPEPVRDEKVSGEQRPADARRPASSDLGGVVINERAPAGANCQYEYPSLVDLQFNNIHWQVMSSLFANSSVNATFYLYSAYYDDRWRAGAPSVRVLAMVDKIQPPRTNCLLWPAQQPGARARPLVTEASFIYAWYPKWGNYKDGILQPWIVTCPIHGRTRDGRRFVPASVSLVQQPARRARVERAASGSTGSSLPLPAYFSSSSSSSSSSAAPAAPAAASQQQAAAAAHEEPAAWCDSQRPITNNLPVVNRRPSRKAKFAVCVKGLDFPHDDLSQRLVEWIELLNVLGADKIFLYDLDVHPNISKVLHYYQQRGLVELTPLTLPGDQPNLPQDQHQYLKMKLTTKRQNELIPYNDCLYRNLYSYRYLALLDIDEIIMPIVHRNWFDLMEEVERITLLEQNYTRASYNVRNVYFFDDLAGPLGTTSSSSSSSAPSSLIDADNSLFPADAQPEPKAARGDQQLEAGIPHYLHMMQHVYRSKNYTKPGQYVKCFHNTQRVVSLHNHFPMNCFGQCTTYSVPVDLAHLQHYRKDCVGPLKQSCKSDFRVFTMRDTTIWKYKQQMIRRTTRVLNYLGLLGDGQTGPAGDQKWRPSGASVA